MAELVEDGVKVLLVKPETFMNLSGRCVRQLVDFYQLPLDDLLVVCDDINLPLALVNVAYLTVLAAVGVWAGARTYRRRLYV